MKTASTKSSKQDSASVQQNSATTTESHTQYEELDEETLAILKSREKNATFISSEEFWDQLSKDLGMNLR